MMVQSLSHLVSTAIYPPPTRLLVFVAAYNPAQQLQPTPTLVTMPHMAQTTTKNVVVVERVVQQQPAAQRSTPIIYVNAQPQQQEEKKEQWIMQDNFATVF